MFGLFKSSKKKKEETAYQKKIQSLMDGTNEQSKEHLAKQENIYKEKERIKQLQKEFAVNKNKYLNMQPTEIRSLYLHGCVNCQNLTYTFVPKAQADCTCNSPLHTTEIKYPVGIGFPVIELETCLTCQKSHTRITPYGTDQLDLVWDCKCCNTDVQTVHTRILTIKPEKARASSNNLQEEVFPVLVPFDVWGNGGSETIVIRVLKQI